jgi:hypothetical protein
MKSSRQSLMIAVLLPSFLLGVVISGRFWYLRSQAIYHDREAKKFLVAVQAATGLPEFEAGKFSEWATDRVETSMLFEGKSLRALPTADTRGYVHHHQLAESYWKAFYNPLVVTQDFLAKPVDR